MAKPELPQRTPTLERVDRFRRAHPEVKISAWHNNPSAKWEVSEPDKAAVAYDRADVMMDDLERRFARS
jgi:hypothetical protein